MITTCFHKTPVGELILGVHKGKLCLLDYRYRKMREAVDQRLQKFLECKYTDGSDPLLDQARQQLHQYFDGSRTDFDLPLALAGTDFQQSVWMELLKIPYGKTTHYSGLAQQLGNEKAVRAVASANGANAIAIIVPCHRVIGSDGTLVGYAGGLTAKRKLLELEQSAVQGEFAW